VTGATEAVAGGEDAVFFLQPVKTRHGSITSNIDPMTIFEDRIDMM
jgi:hypothetical protein